MLYQLLGDLLHYSTRFLVYWCFSLCPRLQVQYRQTPAEEEFRILQNLENLIPTIKNIGNI